MQHFRLLCCISRFWTCIYGKWLLYTQIMDTNLTVPIAEENFERAAVQIKAAAAGGAEMLELRGDYLEDLSVDLVTKLIARI